MSRPDNKAKRSVEQYERHKTAATQLQREKSAKGRDIGPIPAPENPKRRAACGREDCFELESIPNVYVDEKRHRPLGRRNWRLCILQRRIVDNQIQAYYSGAIQGLVC